LKAAATGKMRRLFGWCKKHCNIKTDDYSIRMSKRMGPRGEQLAGAAEALVVTLVWLGV